MNKLIKFGFATLVLVFSIASCSQSTAQSTAQSTDVDQQAVKSSSLSMNIEGMTCAMGCARALEVELNNLDGVEKAKVNFEDSNATLAYNASLTSETTVFTTTIPIVAGAMPATMTISNVNAGGADNVPADDVLTLMVDPVTPAAGKVVVGEEGTGTWCQWCPRGAVFMDKFANDFGQYWAGIAVHNNDPMTVADYDAGIGALIGGASKSDALLLYDFGDVLTLDIFFNELPNNSFKVVFPQLPVIAIIFVFIFCL